ncbi:MAG TPA: nucleotidyltransferase domain-containing protein [Chitinophagaceae bacterium]|jgi:predicted nucleotidyltransferase
MKKVEQILKEYFHNKPVNKAYLFGSLVREETTKSSDIDVLVELDYDKGANYFLFYDMQQELSKLLKNKVDLISANGLSSYIKPIIDREKVLVYERENSG